MKASFVAVVLAVLAAPASASQDIETRAVHFRKGENSATVNGTLVGYQTVDYKLRARAGQTLSVHMDTKHPAAYFNVLPPGSKDVAIFVGSTSGSRWTGALPTDGEYTVRAYLMRSAARRNEKADYALTMGITGSASSSGGLGAAPPGDARIPGTRYHATGTVPCAIGDEKAVFVPCDFGVIRGKPGNAEVYVRPPGGLERVITFMGDTVTAKGARSVKASRAGYDWTVVVNDVERYRIFEAVISGG